MKEILIIDASISIKWFLDEEYSEESLKLLEKEISLIVPELFFIEVYNILTKKVRRKEISIEEATTIKDTITKISFETFSNGSLLESAFELSNVTNKSIYDCIYLSLAVLKKGIMITADEKFYNSLMNYKNYVRWIGDL